MPDGLNIKVNGKMWPVTAAPDTPLLYVLTNELRLQGPRFGCGLAQCGSCSVLADGVEIRSCITPVESIAGKSITTLEGLPALYAQQKTLPQVPAMHPLQQAFIDVQAIQCGYCYNGMTIKGSELLAKNPKPTEAEIRAQFAAFARTGLVLDHVNAHKHFHLHPSLLEMLLRIGGEFGRPGVRVPDEPLWAARHGGAALTGSAAALLLAPWLRLMRRRLRSAGVRHNDRVFGIAFSGSMDEARLLRILERLPPGITEIYLHPATESGRAIAASMGMYRHADELAALLSPRVRSAVAAAGVRSGGYRDLQ